MYKRIALYSLQTFGDTGGIQKMTRTLAHSLHSICSRKNWSFKLASLYDNDSDLMPQYIPHENFKGYGKKKVSFLLRNVFTRQKPDVVILSHINLALVGLLIKLLRPKTQVWLIAHGIEVWRPLSFNMRRLLTRCDKVLCVSNFTLKQMQSLHNVPVNKCMVLNNVLDPFMHLPANFDKPRYLQERYGINPTDKVILSLTRLASAEQYKGHDCVLKALVKVKKLHPNIKYILAGKYDDTEGWRIKKAIADNGLQQHVVLSGFVGNDEVSDLFLTADLFVLPSKKEGFGIVFIEALACGLPVICGNVDGSLDAIRNGELGTAINPDNVQELEEAIMKGIAEPLTLEKRRHLQQQCLAYFSESNYIDTLQKLLTHD